MSDTPTSSSMFDNLAEVPAEALQASLCRLMTCYSLHPCQIKARTIVRIISALLQHPDLGHWQPQQQIYLQLLETWAGIAAVRITGNKSRAATSLH